MAFQRKDGRRLPSDDHLAAIGAVAVIWSAIESSMEMTLLALYEIDMGRGLVFTANLSFHSRLSLMRILVANKVHMNTEQAAEMTTILNRLDSGFGDRNGIIHAVWGPTDKPEVARRMSVRARGKALNATSRLQTAQELWTVVDRLQGLLVEFNTLGDALGVEGLLASASRHSGDVRPKTKPT